MSVISAFFSGILQAVINNDSTKMRCRGFIFIIAARITPFVSKLAVPRQATDAGVLGFSIGYQR